MVAGQQFQVDVLLDTVGEKINATEGKIIFSSDILELKEIRTGNSVINFWIEDPKSDIGGQVVFSGITPGGYQGEKGLLVSLIFLSKKEGQGFVNIQEAKTLLNDGKGTESLLTISNFQFLVFNSSVGVPILQIPISEIKDTESPESFVPEITRDSAIFGGKLFLVFATQDKGLGIDRYEVKEVRQKIFGIFSKWVTAKSPYVLKDQELESHIFVKAVDKVGNERIIEILPKNSFCWYENYANWLIIILGLIIVYVIKKNSWKRYSKK